MACAASCGRRHVCECVLHVHVFMCRRLLSHLVHLRRVTVCVVSVGVTFTFSDLTCISCSQSTTTTPAPRRFYFSHIGLLALRSAWETIFYTSAACGSCDATVLRLYLRKGRLHTSNGPLCVPPIDAIEAAAQSSLRHPNPNIAGDVDLEETREYFSSDGWQAG
jgi:hypothetical protein